MLFTRSKEFEKKFKKLSMKIKLKAVERLNVFTANSQDPILNDHALHGEYNGFRSIDVTGDMRIIYKIHDADVCRLVNIGTHHQLYGL